MGLRQEQSHYRRQRRGKKEARGVVLPAVLLAVFFLSLVSGVLVQTLAWELTAVKRFERRQQALYLAEAGVAHAVMWLKEGKKGQASAEFTETLGPGYYRVRVSGMGRGHGGEKAYLILASGYLTGQPEATLYRTVRVEVSQSLHLQSWEEVAERVEAGDEGEEKEKRMVILCFPSGEKPLG